MSDNVSVRSGEIWNFERARRDVVQRKMLTTDEIVECAEGYNLSDLWIKLLLTVSIDWARNRMSRFREHLENIIAVEEAPPAVKATAFEMLASSYSRDRDGASPRKYREMSEYALNVILSADISEEDYAAIDASVCLGLIEQGLNTTIDDIVRGYVLHMVNSGAFNAPSRVLEHYPGDKDWLERLIARADSAEHAFHPLYLDKARAELEKLRAG